MNNKKILLAIVAVIFSLSLFSCATNQVEQQQTDPVAVPLTPIYWSGDGGKGIRLAVLEPTGKGLSETEKWMPSMIQGSITGDFQKYSAMTIIDRQNLEKILNEQRQSLSGDFSDEDYISIGKVTNARYILAGSITKTASAYMLELAVTDVESGERKASYPPKAVSPFALENLSAIKDAAAELLRQLGVNLTEQGQRELNNLANTGQIQAETALARGIAAQRQGTIVEALSYFIQASNYDSGLAEATSRMNILTANISSGNIGEDTRNDIAWRRQWVARLREAETFFANTIKEPQPFYIVYSTNIRQGKVDYQKETTDLSVWMGFYPDFAWSNQINGMISAVKNGLQATGRTRVWELDWPAKAVSTPSPFINQTKNSTSTVVVEIINDEGKSIGRQTVKAPYGFECKDSVITPLWQGEGDVSFPSVDANSITNTLSIRITSIDGITAETAARQKKISIMPQSEWEAVLKINTVAKKNIEAAQVRNRAEELRKQADEYLRNGNIGYAVTVYSQAIRLNPDNAAAYNGRGQAYSKQGDYDQAIADWERALRINPNLVEAGRNIETARQQWQREWERQAQEQRQKAQALFESGKKSLDIRDYNRAIADLTEAIRLDPFLNDVYFYRAMSYAEIRRYDSAIADYTQVLRVNPYEWGAYRNRGLAYIAKGDYDRAIADFTEVLRLNPNYAGAYENRGYAYGEKNNYNMAIADYTQAIRLNPNNATTYNNRGVAYNKTGERNRAIADFQAALRIDPNHTNASNNLRQLSGR